MDILDKIANFIVCGIIFIFAKIIQYFALYLIFAFCIVLIKVGSEYDAGLLTFLGVIGLIVTSLLTLSGIIRGIKEMAGK